MTIDDVNIHAAAAQRALKRLHDALPGNNDMMVLHANLQILDEWATANMSGYVSPAPQDGTPKH